MNCLHSDILTYVVLLIGYTCSVLSMVTDDIYMLGKKKKKERNSRLTSTLWSNRVRIFVPE